MFACPLGADVTCACPLANWMTLPRHGKVRSIEGGADVVARERVEAPAKPRFIRIIRIIRPAVQAAVEAVVADRTQAVADSVHASIVSALAGAGLREGA